MMRGPLRSLLSHQGARAVASIDQLAGRSCLASTLARHQCLPVTKDAWRRTSCRGFSQASSGDAKTERSSEKPADQDVDEKADEKGEETADAKAGEKAEEKADEKAGEKAEEQAEKGGADAKADELAKEEVLEDPDAKLSREVEELQGQMKEKRHKVLLALADFENSKKKLAKEREAKHRRAIVSFATKMVDVYGQFEKKLPVDTDAAGEAQASLQEGISLVRQAFGQSLGRFDVKPLTISQGEQFVVAQHESIGTIIGSEHADGVIAEVVKPGWIFKPSKGAPAVLARAQVKVARNGPGAPASK